MAELQSLFPDIPVVAGKKKSKVLYRGCDYCPTNKKKGINKIMGKVRGRKVFVWVQSPGPDENRIGKELVGKTGKWFWKEMERAGITRDMCDIQNVVRCWPADKEDGEWVMRNPSKEELFCCSTYNERAIKKSEAVIHLVCGKVAADQLFGKKNSKHRSKVFWSSMFNAKVVIVDHPSYFLRGAPRERLEKFRWGLLAAAEAVSNPGRYSFLEKQDYKGVRTAEAAKLWYRVIKEAAKKRRVSVDVEDDVVNGKRTMLCIGFSWKKGTARTFFLDHPLVEISREDRKVIRKYVVMLLEDSDVRKAMHYGSYDVGSILDIMGVEVQGYEWDTYYGEYLAHPGERAFGLARIAERRFPEFGQYKEIIAPEAVAPGATQMEASITGEMYLSKLPERKMVMYNGADCDLTKRCEVSTKGRINKNLLRVYMDAGEVIPRMEVLGPLFDFKHYDRIVQIYPPRAERYRQKLQVMTGNPDFNPNTPAEVSAFMYGTLDLPIVTKTGIPDTRKETIEMLMEMEPHPFLATLQKYKTATGASKYMVSYKQSADKHRGRLRTKWWLTGTETGRMRSGGDEQKKVKGTGIVNLQNIHGEPALQNLLVSDIQWRRVYEGWKKANGEGDWWLPFLDYEIYLSFDYSQMEIRYMAEMSGDPLLLKMLKAGIDIHAGVGHELTGWAIEKIMKDKKTRTLIKNMHFGLLFGLMDKSLHRYLIAKGVKVGLEKVTKMLKRYFKRFHYVKKFIDKMHRDAEEKGYVENLFGFRRYLDQAGNDRKSFWKNQAVNSPIQGGAHQCLVMALALLERKPNKYKLLQDINMEVHDALVFSVKLGDLMEGYKLGKRLLEKEVPRLIKREFYKDWQVPLEAEAEVGFRYGARVEYEGQKDLGAVLNAWCEKTRVLERKVTKELKNLKKVA